MVIPTKSEMLETPMPFEGFVFSEETSFLSDAEYEASLRFLEYVARSIEYRERLAASNPEQAKIFLPDEGWHPDNQPSFELDGSTKNAQTSYELLATGDRDIIRKLRLYGHAFTGYQLATLELAENRPWLSRKLPGNWDDVLMFLAGPPRKSVFDYVSVANRLPEELRADAPRKFGEIGWLIDGKIVNDDVSSYQSILCLLHENGLISGLREKFSDGRPLHIIEIGGGYGGLGYFLSKLFQEKIRYTIIDIPESLAFSSIYLSVLFPNLNTLFIDSESAITSAPKTGFTFVPNMYSRTFTQINARADLVINTLSLSEMSDEQIHDYCQQISIMIGDTGIFFEQNHQSDHQGPGGILPMYLKILRKCSSQILPESFPKRRGTANIWVNASYKG